MTEVKVGSFQVFITPDLVSWGDVLIFHEQYYFPFPYY